jgi:polyisoprenoid-binding protein YceI
VQADTFKIDPVHSSIVFSVTHLGVSNFYGRFNGVSGTVVLDKAQPSKSSFNVTIPVESIDTHSERARIFSTRSDFR